MPEADVSKYSSIAKFNTTLIENMALLTKMDNYYDWITSIFKKDAGQRVLEIGCANGNVTRAFLDRELIVATDYSKKYLRVIKERFSKNNNFRAKLLDITDTSKALQMKKYAFDTIITMNTFEHIQDDQLAISNSYKILKKGGKFIIFVPAMKFLYSILDYEGGHFRRYTKQELKLKLEKAGFKIKTIRYVNFAGAIGWYVMHTFLKKRIYSSTSFSLYNSLVPIFKFVENILPMPVGLSVFCVAIKE